MTEKTKPKFFYGYVIVAAGFLINMATWGTLYSFGIFFKPVLSEFGWTRAATAGAYSLCIIFSGIGNVIVGRLTDRFGPRMVVAVFGIVMGAGYILVSQIHAIWQFYLYYGVLLGIGTSVNIVPLASTISRWFIKRRGMMMGIIVSGIGIGTFIMPPIANWLITTYSWRNSYLVVGIAVLLLMVVAAQFLRHDPRQMGLSPYGESEAGKSSSHLSIGGLSLSQAISTRQFWMVCAMYFCWGFAAQLVIVHIVPHATDLAVPTAQAASVLALVGGISVAGRLGLGGASDRIGSKTTAVICFILLSVALLWLPLARELWMFYLFAVVYSLGYGGLVALQTLLIADLFGVISLGVILGMIIFIGALGEAVGPAVGGWIFDVTGSYRWAFLASALLCILAIFLTALLKPVTQKNRG